MLNGLMGAFITTQKATYQVGEFPVYVITSAQPGAEIVWTSWFSAYGPSAFEYQQPYGQYVGPDGTLVLVWPDALRSVDVGAWKRRVDLINPDGTADSAEVLYDVVAADQGATVPARAPVLTPVPSEPVPIPAPTNGQIPPRSLYPVDVEPRPVIDRGGDIIRPVVVATPDILNPAPLPPLPSPLPAPIPAELPAIPIRPQPSTEQPPVQQPPVQAPGLSLGGSIKIGGMDIPIWALAIGVILLLKGGR